ncbi:flagellar hook-basal body complex protein FliE [Pyrinomonas methylaliphatogenes]|jgi:flagellar hook-basal body complex protein FliE|uniref:Flagellar hook-basal body complex protein FliE n=1 Tax=Pyrinomonas methylaliphatogenes TaxID=454194 RepID=A0A0B6WWI4_9BACT|nr:flagellar hook-basal body complex protein FliE [Pyrinomonas methylaliphatogenes]MBX5477573.1 flagellar hook-basal body complex protein FliE [Pyrinomonas methylaliphatogenes]CDM65643.1 flagellar hook-basal body complex protein FliE [Pyrinomonas methylaliphatogenes]
MNLNGINLDAPLATSTENPLRVSSAPTSFAEMVRQTIDALDQSQKGAEMEIARAVAGESPDLHQTIIALQAADLNFQFALQVRNKLIGAYEEIMRMQV